MMVLRSPNAQLLGEQLRIRQEDTTRVTVLASGNQPGQENMPTEVLRINPDRLREFLEKRAALLDPEADCELRDIQRWGEKNKLQGKVMVRKNNEKRIEHILARKIQLQYLAHRHRNQMQQNVTRFIRSVRVSVVNIQRIFRGHRAKCDYHSIRGAWLEHKRRAAAVRTIINAFRRYRRRLRHRRSMTVESVAQAQLINLLANKLNESADTQDAAERYRRVGEERRRQRIVLLQKHKMEQQEMERRRNVAAVRMQAIVRSHLAQGQVRVLREEKMAHMSAVSAMAIQSKIRKFLNVQQERRQRFRKDLERVNQSAVRIQSIYRGYNSRASLLLQLDDKTRRKLVETFTASALHERNSDAEDDEDDEEDASDNDDDEEALIEHGKVIGSATQLMPAELSFEPRLPPIATSSSRPPSGRSNPHALNEPPPSQTHAPPNPVSLPPIWTRDGSSSSLISSISSTSTGRRISMGMTRIELRLKEAELGDNFETPPSRRNSFVGNMRHQT
ncbi:IQ motif, EF-hand binding site [Phytophthora cinnamomi]|uniref:IQ motif, EF-hand binding site n=1 Tax=Phytophthora cinnamomi TaxID=4785 RepID=UPI00355A6649|nr:IQ motif, EF-hand binding site [Phytophthora cinnamomi]